MSFIIILCIHIEHYYFKISTQQLLYIQERHAPKMHLPYPGPHPETLPRQGHLTMYGKPIQFASEKKRWVVTSAPELDSGTPEDSGPGLLEKNRI